MTADRSAIPLLASIADVSEGRKAWLCDVWGVIHDGVTVFPEAVQAFEEFRRRGGKAILISNSPRPSPGLVPKLASMGFPASRYDALVTSGDVTRLAVEAHIDQPMFHIGPPRDKPFFDGLPVKLVPPEKAEIVVCTGFFDEDREKAEDYDTMLAEFASHGATMICANPDLVVERGDTLLPCAGLLAARYEAMGQKVIQAGKPYPPIYDLAIEKIGMPIEASDLLAIGDGVDTDIKGASSRGIDSVYVVSRVHLGHGAEDQPLAAVVASLFASRPFRPLAAMSRLSW